MESSGISTSETTKKVSGAKPSSSPFGPFRSKKIIKSISESASSDEAQAADPHQWSLKTPEKPTQLPRRIRNQGFALSVKEVKKIAQGLRKKTNTDAPSDQLNRNRIGTSTSLSSEYGSSDSAVGKSSKTEASTKLPEKYEMLAEFFDSMESSIRLLRLKGSLSTFTNISPKIEALTDRRFSYGHLAQLKYILPGAIITKKVLMHDEGTLCMKPELQVTLQTDAFENDGKRKVGSGHLNLRKVFRERLLDFFKAHPEGDDIPEEVLPEPFNQKKQNILQSAIKTCNPTSSNVLQEHLPERAAHLSQSFQRRFSQKVPMSKTEHNHLQQHIAPPEPSDLPVLNPCLKESSSTEEPRTSAALSPFKYSSKPLTSERLSTFCASPSKSNPSSNIAEVGKKTELVRNEDCSLTETVGTQGTPTKLDSTPAKLIVTPTLQTPKRCRMSPGDDLANSLNKLVRRPKRSRSLKFDTPVKKAKTEEETNETRGSSIDKDIIEILPKALLQSIRDKERKAKEERDAGTCRAKRRQQMIACLPKLFDMIHLIFQSAKRSVMTKEELMHKIIASHCDITDKREVQEQLSLMEELVPDWISGKVSSSGDYIFCVNKNSSPLSIRLRLSEAE
ncbi:PREDICTED: CDT1-like protein a, chloroplastic [Nelumbo nucifera]|uniref:CDT1 Geminin-binding domain-containing protein n=2 Tax=Nelumbo nucifera TaxID=4432 RepID=A0A822Y8I7_NELNU|nr:PREDICTED: CDT1-like protein a, chloroplastic [Nelumbo nucifera]DAD28737.1 TPA_asm: hypothetical protein HUJ06_030205 [Nelumbo nucifera]